jgi:hypothetical protein
LDASDITVAHPPVASKYHCTEGRFDSLANDIRT